MMKSVISVLFLLLFVNILTGIHSQNVNLQQLSYGGEPIVPYKPPTTTTTTTETPTTKSSSFFGGIKNWFRKSPAPEDPENTSTTTTTTTPRSGAQVPPSPAPTGQRDYVAPKSSTSYPDRRDNVNPNMQTSPTSPQQPPAQPSSPTAPTQSNTSGRRDYVNPNIPFSPPSAGKPNPPSIPPPSPTPNQFPSLPAPSTPSGRRDYVNPNIPQSPQSPKVKEDFPALPPPRQPQGQSTTSTGSASTVSSVWNNRPDSPTGTTPQSPWGSRPGQPGSPDSKPTMVSFVPTVRPSATRSGSQAKPEQPSLATDNELTTLTENLLSKDVNNLNKYITVNLQGVTKSYLSTDEAPNPLLQIDPKAFEVPTVAKMKLLFNNYELDSSVNEYVTPIEKKEENDLIDALLATSVMRQAMLFLQEKGIVTADPKTHRELLKTVWFSLYSRGNGRIGSSGFEHIFLSEIKNGTVTGLHNALYFHEEEQKGHIDYKGYLRKLDFGNKGSIVKYRFDFNGIQKPVNAMFIGLSPEMELALYTVCFEVRADKDCPVSLNGQKFNLPTYTFRYRGKRLIGSAFPEI